ncbi:HDOD domain-containing protein, partial [Marinobacter manganoxydans]
MAVDEVSGSLQEGLLSWLLNVEPHQLEKTDERTSAIVAQLESRISSGKLEELPRQPLILPKLLHALSKENSDRRELVSIILKDPALTNRVLQVANSPFFRSGDQHIESVDQ